MITYLQYLSHQVCEPAVEDIYNVSIFNGWFNK